MPSYRAGDLIPEIINAAEAAGVPANLAVALFTSEHSSDGRIKPDRMVDTTVKGITPTTGKPSGAVGLFQNTGETLRGLIKQGYLPTDFDFSTKEGQIAAGIATIKAKMLESGSSDPREIAAYWSDGQAGLKGVRGQGPMPQQAAGFIQKVQTAMTTDANGVTTYPSNGAGPRSPEALRAMYPTREKLPGAQEDLARTYKALQDAGNPIMQMLNAIGVGTSSAIEQAQLNQEALGDAKATQAIAIGNVEVNKQDIKDRKAVAFGADLSPDSAMMRAQHEYTKNLAGMAQLKPGIDRLVAKSAPLSAITDPVGWIVSQFQLSQLAPRYNSMVQNKDTAARVVNTLQTNAQNQNTIGPAVEANLLTEEATANANVAKLEAQRAIAALSVTGYQEKSRILAEKFGVLSKEYQAAYQMVGFELTSGIKADKQMTDFLEKRNARVAPLGGMPVTSAEEYKSHSPALKQLEARIATNGGDLGTNLLFVREMSTLPTIRQNDQILAKSIDNYDAQIQTEMQAIVNKQAGIGPKLKEEDLYIQAADNLVKRYRADIASANGVMTAIAPTNPWKFNATIAFEDPAVKNTKLVSALRELAPKNQSMSDKDILGQAIAQVNTGRPQAEVVAELVALYTTGLAHQYAKTGMETLGLGTVPVGTGSAYRIDGNTMGTGGWRTAYKAVNMQNATDVDNMLTREIIAYKSSNAAQNALMEQTRNRTDVLGGNR